MEEWPSSALRMRTTNHVGLLESSVDWSLYINIKKKKIQYCVFNVQSEADVHHTGQTETLKKN